MSRYVERRLEFSPLLPSVKSSILKFHLYFRPFLKVKKEPRVFDRNKVGEAGSPLGKARKS